MLSEVFTFRLWDEVLRECGLKPLPPPSVGLPSIDEVFATGGAGEGAAHKRLKEAIAEHPELVRLPKSYAPGAVEAPLYSGDRVDVLFSAKDKRVAVEVKPAGAPLGDLVRGVFQCVKYAAVLDAQARVAQTHSDCKAILALGGPLSADLASLCVTLGIKVHKELGTNGSPENRHRKGTR